MEITRLVLLPKITSALPWLPISVEPTTFLLIYVGLFVAGLLIGLIGSLFAMRRYLKV
jgi:cell division transport system permease protein